MEKHRALVEEHIARWTGSLPDDPLYAPMAYLVKLPAKRVRPLLTLMACEMFGGRSEDVLNEAVAIELFHNFTLMHDDIMDRSRLRRGMATVHEKWNANTAILSGDALLVKAYQLMGLDPAVLTIFNRYALEVCEGQQKDMSFETRSHVSLNEYREMIRLKTAVLLAGALKIGACKAGASVEDQERIGLFGESLGSAFQLRDDLLDAFGDQATLGKQIGGDLRAGKKTWLLIRGSEVSVEKADKTLEEELAKTSAARNVEKMIDTLKALGVHQEAEAEIERLEALARRQLNAISVPEAQKTALREMVAKLQARVA
ncbi:MAG: polyprenyl synthetase family protein [Flavobacteriales bacterium]|nr:polyprenyl synthetase family protein [Flavobacteriales bacterium]